MSQSCSPRCRQIGLLVLCASWTATAGLVASPLDFWTNQLTVTNLIFHSAAFGQGKFVVGASIAFQSGGAVFTSDDGRQWRKTLDDPATLIVYGNERFVADRGDGWIHVSSNGEDWVSRLPPGHQFLGNRARVDFGLGRFWVDKDVDVPASHLRFSSFDGLLWKLETTNAPPAGSTRFFGDRFLSVSESFLESFDGVEFSPAIGWPPIHSVAFNKGTWVVVDASLTPGSPPPGTISVSTNGTTWSSLVVTKINTSNQKVTASGGRFFLTVEANYFFESVDGFNWTDHRVVGGNYRKVSSVVHGADSLLALCNYQETFQKPAYTAISGIVFQSQPLIAPHPSLLAASLKPTLSLLEGHKGAGYLIESSSTPDGPWVRETRVFPSSFPYMFLAPGADANAKLFRAVSE